MRHAATFLTLGSFVLVWAASTIAAEPLPVVTDVELQPLSAGVKRVAQALEFAGAPLSAEQQAALDKALATSDQAEAVKQVQAVLDPLCLVGVNINPESRVKVAAGEAPPCSCSRVGGCFW